MTTMRSNGFTRIPLARPQRSVAGRIIAVLAGTLLLAAALMFSLLALAVLVIVGVLAYAWLRWKTRHLQQNLREQMRAHAARAYRQSDEQPARGLVLEGEVIGAAEFEPASPSSAASHSSHEPDDGSAEHPETRPTSRFTPPARGDS